MREKKKTRKYEKMMFRCTFLFLCIHCIECTWYDDIILHPINLSISMKWNRWTQHIHEHIVLIWLDGYDFWEASIPFAQFHKIQKILFSLNWITKVHTELCVHVNWILFLLTYWLWAHNYWYILDTKVKCINTIQYTIHELYIGNVNIYF